MTSFLYPPYQDLFFFQTEPTNFLDVLFPRLITEERTRLESLILVCIDTSIAMSLDTMLSDTMLLDTMPLDRVPETTATDDLTLTEKSTIQ
ncbi:MAG: hypothetical protein B0A82_14615 [Alkalinema sp. CACIAM 70d]|nr:MAG: hypothetical protein B0A82_14615 [Alkalinema sp. CACIAM 70d]